MWNRIRLWRAQRSYGWHKLASAVVYLDEPDVSGLLTSYAAWAANRDATELLLARLPWAWRTMIKFDRLQRWAPESMEKEN